MKRKYQKIDPYIEKLAGSYLNYNRGAELILDFLISRYPPQLKIGRVYVNKEFWLEFRRAIRVMYKYHWTKYFCDFFPKQRKNIMAFGYPFRKRINLANKKSRLPVPKRSPAKKSKGIRRST